MQSSRKNKIAFVIPWFGEKIPGGAETLLRDLVAHLKEYFTIEILTTCVKEFLSDWNVNHWREGDYTECDITVRRFKVRKRNIARFDEINAKLINGAPVTEEEESLFMRESIRSDRLTDHIKKHKEEYRKIICIPYMFGTTYDTIFAAGEKSALISCFHDESYAHMKVFRQMVEKTSLIFFNAQSEKKLAEKIFGADKKYRVVGVGVDTNLKFQQGVFAKKYNIPGPYILYAGRKDATKNVPELVEYFDRYRCESGNDIYLVLIGPSSIPLPANDHILDLGFVSVEDKYNAMADALAICQPSKNESFSIVMMEGFLCERPALVNEMCEVTRDHAFQSNGGLVYSDYYTFYECVEYLRTHVATAEEMGKNGKRYVLKNYTWPTVTAEYLKVLT